MIAHIVLFRPRPHLPDAERQLLADSFTRALQNIPTVRRAIIGRRIVLGAPYEQLSREDYPYAAVIGFDDLSGLQAYLAHAAHEEPARRFYEAIEAAVVFDYEIVDGRAVDSAVMQWLQS